MVEPHLGVEVGVDEEDAHRGPARTQDSAATRPSSVIPGPQVACGGSRRPAVPKHGPTILCRIRTTIVLAALAGALSAAPQDPAIVSWGRIKGDSRLLHDSYRGVAAGHSCTFGVRPDGMLSAWGHNSEGQCEVLELPPGVRYDAVSSGGSFLHASSFTVALRSDGRIEAWGAEHSGQLKVPALPPGLTYTAVDAGLSLFTYGHALAIRSDGTAVGWGQRVFGQL